MKFLGVLIFMSSAVLVFGQTTTQEVTATDGEYHWETAANWTNGLPSGSPSAITNVNADITIASGTYIYANTALSFSNNGGNSNLIVISGTLVVRGDMFFDQNSLEIDINSGGSLIVLGDLESNNKADISNSGQLLVLGNLTLNGGNVDYSDGNGSSDNLWVGGTIGGSNSTAVANAQADDEPDLNSGTFPQSSVDEINEWILPVDLMSFNSVQSANSGIELKWVTATELNNDYFSVERSEDGFEFYEIGRVKGNGTSNEVQNYSFTDYSPVASIQYYRLHQVDFDGTSEIYKAIVVNISGVSKKVSSKVFPNPAKDDVELQFDRPTAVNEISLIDLSGKVIIRIIPGIQSRVNYEMPLPSLEKGLYYLNYKTADGYSGSQKLVVE